MLTRILLGFDDSSLRLLMTQEALQQTEERSTVFKIMFVPLAMVRASYVNFSGKNQKHHKTYNW
jgi:hypothetical protein